jgi:hypothetical protein
MCFGEKNDEKARFNRDLFDAINIGGGRLESFNGNSLDLKLKQTSSSKINKRNHS